MTSLNYTLDEKQLISLPYDLLISVSIRFWLYLIPNILSVLCSVFVLFHLLFNRILRQALNNHVIIILLFVGLIYELIDVPLMLHYYRFGNTWQLTTSFAHFWTFIDYLCYAAQLIGFAWATIERHILIFHNQWVSTRKKRFFVHYFPLMTLLTYLFTYYFVMILFPFCEDFIIPSPFNGVPVACFLFYQISLAYDTLSHQIIPTFIIIIMSSALLLRVLWQKSRLNRSIEWQKQRKMTIQLLSISILYLLFMGPRTVLQICLFIGLTTNSVLTSYMYSAFFANYIIFLFPFVCCGTLPELGKKLKKLFICRKQRQVIVPTTLPVRHIVTQ